MRIESRGGGTGRRTGFKIRRPCGREGSTPSFGTKQDGDDFLRRRVAQLAERCLDMAEVTGSNPVAPTTSAETAIKHPAAKTLKIKTPRIADPGRLRSVRTLRVQRLLAQSPSEQTATAPQPSSFRNLRRKAGLPSRRSPDPLSREIPDIFRHDCVAPDVRDDGGEATARGGEGIFSLLCRFSGIKGSGSGSGRKIFFCGGILRYNWTSRPAFPIP